ncbi:hypothetical protein QJS10_CPB21g00898 [Acorus calamus]|uniref:PGG domain-containing protein n=1 Tax=Acorus calamus TaxID=4465 RepID=A0AAV9C5F2_ACOCL|nr:hypothetical protein QJS10_CPB21g00898 [Acorus calamus]
MMAGQLSFNIPAGNSALHVAVMTGEEGLAKNLCNERPSLLVEKNEEGNTPLHCSLKSGCDESLVKFFLLRVLKEGTPLLEANKDGESLLFLAADRESLEIVKLLLVGDGLATDFRGPNGWTALHAAVFRRNFDNKRRNALHLAIEGGHYGVFKDMLRSPFSAWLRRDRDCDGNTPLHLAAIRGRNSMVYHLTSVEYETDMNPLNNAGLTRDILYPGNFSFASAAFSACVDFSFAFRGTFIKAGGKNGPGLYRLKRRDGDGRGGRDEEEGRHPVQLDAGGCGGRDEEEEGRHQVQSLEKLANNLLLVATLIITVTFAAIITMPGGFESDKGTAVLAKRASFQAFVILDTIAFLLAFWAATRLLWTVFWRRAAVKMDIKLAKNMVHAALMAMALAFGTGAYSVLVHRCSWAGTVVLVMACVFALGPCFGLLSYLLIFYYSIKRKVSAALWFDHSDDRVPSGYDRWEGDSSNMPWPIKIVRCLLGLTRSRDTESDN